MILSVCNDSLDLDELVVNKNSDLDLKNPNIKTPNYLAIVRLGQGCLTGCSGTQGCHVEKLPPNIEFTASLLIFY